MLKYIKKFLLDILPSVVATIVGAYIVHHYIIPAATPQSPAAAVANADPKPDVAKPDVVKAEPAPADKPSFIKGVAEKAAIEKTAEKAAEKTADTASADSRKRHAPPRKSVAPDQTASVPESPASDERRDANDLARAAIERLRSSESRTVAVAPQAALPALPPTVTLAPPSPDVFSAGTGAIMAPTRPAQTVTSTRSADASKPTPPAEIPGPAPIELHGDIVTTGRATTVADDVMSAAKSVFHAVLPR